MNASSDARPSVWPSVALLIAAQWPLCAALLDYGTIEFSSTTVLGLLLTLSGVVLAWLARRPRWAAAALPVAAVLLSAGVFLGLRNAAFSVFLILAIFIWLVIAVALVQRKPTVTKIAMVLTIFFVFALLAEMLMGRVSFSGSSDRKRRMAATGGSLKGQIEMPDREALAQLVPMGMAVARKVQEDGVLDFEATYHTDRYGSRAVPGRPESGPEWYFFGCSATFGEGLNDDETFAAHIQQMNTGARVYNFGIRNAGPTDGWIHLKRKLAAGAKPVWCIYFFMDDHFRRAGLPDLTMATQGDRPHAVLKDGRPVLLGKAKDTIGSAADQLRINLVRRSKVFSALRSGWRPTSEDVELVAALIQSMRDESERVPGCRFFAVLLPFEGRKWEDRVAELESSLGRRHVPVLNLREAIDEYVRTKKGGDLSQLFFADSHPRAEYAAVVAQAVNDYIAKQEVGAQSQPANDGASPVRTR